MYSLYLSYRTIQAIHTNLKPGADEEIHQDRLQLCLARLEVITGNENLPLDSQLDGPWHKGILGGAVDVGAALQNAGNSKERRRGHL